MTERIPQELNNIENKWDENREEYDKELFNRVFTLMEGPGHDFEADKENARWEDALKEDKMRTMLKNMGEKIKGLEFSEDGILQGEIEGEKIHINPDGSSSSIVDEDRAESLDPEDAKKIYEKFAPLVKLQREIDKDDDLKKKYDDLQREYAANIKSKVDKILS